MASMIKLHVFRGVGSEDLDQFWFIVRVVWEAHRVMDDNIKKATLVSALQDCALTRYIKKSGNHLNVGIAKIWDTLKK